MQEFLLLESMQNCSYLCLIINEARNSLSTLIIDFQVLSNCHLHTIDMDHKGLYRLVMWLGYKGMWFFKIGKAH